MLLLIAAIVSIAGCNRGPIPPSPTVALVPAVVGVVDTDSLTLPIALEGGRAFAPPDGQSAVQIFNWPATVRIDGEEYDGTLLLGGQDPALGAWYQIAGLGGRTEDGCWMIDGGSFDDGDSIWFPSGLRIPKADSFEIRTYGHDIDAFPGRESDGICVDSEGEAVYFHFTPGM